MGLKLTSFLIAIIIVGLFIISFSNMLGETHAEYNVTYGNNTLNNINKINDIYNVSKDIEKRHSEDETDPSWFDIIGNLLADGLDSIKLTFKGYGLMIGIGNDAVEQFGLPSAFKIALYSILVILVIIGIFISAKIGRDL